MIIKASFCTSLSDAVSVYSVVMTANGREVVVANKYTVYDLTTKDDMVLIVDVREAEYDSFFDSADGVRDAIAAYYGLKNSKRLLLDPQVARFNPDNIIEEDGYSESGSKKYRLADVTNGHMAILATCAYYLKYSSMSAASDTIDDITEYFSRI